jgi:hypothetical protein
MTFLQSTWCSSCPLFTPPTSFSIRLATPRGCPDTSGHWSSEGQAYFAVAEDAHNFVTPREELAGCSAIGEHKFCPLEVARSDWAEHCLAALFKGLWKEALAICEVSTFKGRWAAERTSHKRFDVVVTADTPFRTRCSSNGTISVDGVWRPGQHNVTVESSCFVSTASFSLHGAVSNGVRVAVQPATDWLSAAEATQALEERQVRQKEAEDVLAGRLAGAIDDMRRISCSASALGRGRSPLKERGEIDSCEPDSEAQTSFATHVMYVERAASDR